MDNSGTVDHYAEVLADLKAQRARIDEAIRTLEAVRGGPLVTGRPAPVSLATSATTAMTPARSYGGGDQGHSPYLGMSIPDAAKALLASKRRQLKTGDIVEALEAGGLILTSADKANTVGSVLLRRFYTVGDIVRIARGVWGLQEWYPGRKFPRAQGKPEEGEKGDAESSSENEADTQSHIEPNDDTALRELGLENDKPEEPQW